MSGKKGKKSTLSKVVNAAISTGIGINTTYGAVQQPTQSQALTNRYTSSQEAKSNKRTRTLRTSTRDAGVRRSGTSGKRG